MDSRTAIDVVNFLCERFDVVRHVVSLGGHCEFAGYIHGVRASLRLLM